jgi:predicted amidophosphoribosyltransferase
MPEPAAGLRTGDRALDLQLPGRQPDYPLQAQAKWPFGHLLGELACPILQHRFDNDLPRPDTLVPVPLAANACANAVQSGGDAGALAEPTPRIPSMNSCSCDPGHHAQQDLDAKARKRNLRRPSPWPRCAPEGRHLALVDDVLTTGATAHALARLLMEAGPPRVDVYCLARTPKPGESP